MDDPGAPQDDLGPLEDLAEHAHETHVVVVGGGIAGLVVALSCATVGLRVTVIDSADRLGGVIRAEVLGGGTVDVGADGWAAGGGDVRRLVEQLGLGASIEAERPTAPLLGGLSRGPAPMPGESVLGIPANPWDPAVRRIIGWSGVWRAYLDRLRPPLTIGQQRNLGALVAGRMGRRVVDRLVAPLSVGRHGLHPGEVDVDVAAPGLNPALTRTGSLGGAVAQVRGDRAPGAGYETLRGGMTGLVDALADRLGVLGARIETGATVSEVAPAAGGGWTVRHDGESLHADSVVVATGEETARRLIAPHAPAVEHQSTSERPLDVVTLLARGWADDLPAAVYALPGTALAAALVVPAARWPWIEADTVLGGRVVRVMFPGGLPEGDPVALACAAASVMTGKSVTAADVEDARVDRYSAAAPRSALGQLAEAERVRAAVDAVPALAVVGAWIAGSGLAQVVPDAAAQAERIRRRALFGAASTE